MQLDNNGEGSDTANASKPLSIPMPASPSPSLERFPTGSPDFSPRVSSPLNPLSSSHSSPPPTPPSHASNLRRRPSQLSQFVGYTPTQAETRLVESREDTVELSSLLGPDDRLRFFRCIDNDLLPALVSPAERAKAVTVMETMLRLLENALEKGLGKQGDKKYLQIKLVNPAIRSKLDLDGKGSKQKGAASLDYLHLCGWRYKVQDFQEYLYFPEDPTPKTLAEMRTGHRILATRVAKEQESAAKSSARQADAKKEEADRVKNALAQIKEDREKVKEVSERERQARAATATATSPTSRTSALSPGTPSSSLPPH